eukprot:366436-Chlamydomonas_euryale.AAC.5
MKCFPNAVVAHRIHTTGALRCEPQTRHAGMRSAMAAQPKTMDEDELIPSDAPPQHVQHCGQDQAPGNVAGSGDVPWQSVAQQHAQLPQLWGPDHHCLAELKPLQVQRQRRP